MRTTLNIKDELIKKAQKLTGIREKTALIHKGLEALMRQIACERLIKLGGSDPRASVPSRRRS